MIIFLMFALLLIGLILFFIIARFLGLWFQAYVSGTPIKLFNIIGMSLRKIPPRIIVESRIISSKAGLSGIEVSDLETHYLAGGNVENVIQAMIAATKASIPLDWKTATAIDLAGRNVLDAVKTSVNPKVIDCPSSDPDTSISAVSKNGIQLKVRARVTVRTNIRQLVGGATEETVIARVGEGIISAVGSAESHEQVLANPRAISELVLHKGLDAQTAFEIVSIDIADIDVGENIGAKLRIEKADADKSIAQAEAEKRRAMAVAEEQENSAKVVLQQAEVPKAIAQALRDGNLGVMDYYRMQNTLADTNMREGISGKSIKNSIKPK